MEKEEQRKNCRALVGFKEYDIMLTKEQSVLKSVNIESVIKDKQCKLSTVS